MQAFPVLALLPLLASPAAAQELTPALMEEDLFHLSETFRSLHAGLHRYTEEEELDELLGEALYAIGEEPGELQYYRILCRVVSGVRCGHTKVRMTRPQLERMLADSALLPFHVHLVGERAWVLSAAAGARRLRAGQEILSIDGHSIPEIRATAFEMLYADGFIETGKQRELEERFARHYALLVEDPRNRRRTHLVELAGEEEAVEVEGISLADFEALERPGPERPFMALTHPREDVAHLYLREFGDPRGGEPDFPTQLERHFAALREAKIPNLVLDLRGNGGGSDEYGALLVSYLSPEPFGYFADIRVTEEYGGPGDVVERDGLRYVTAHPGLQLQQPAEHRFEGRVFLLTDGWTFSTAADVATVAHFHDLVTVVGEETGGGYDGNTSGRSQGEQLPGSGFTVSVPMWMYTTANAGHDRFGRGVPPDHELRPSVEDVLAGRDAELERVLRLVDEARPGGG